MSKTLRQANIVDCAKVIRASAEQIDKSSLSERDKFRVGEIFKNSERIISLAIWMNRDKETK